MAQQAVQTGHLHTGNVPRSNKIIQARTDVLCTIFYATKVQTAMKACSFFERSIVFCLLFYFPAFVCVLGLLASVAP